MKSLVEADCGGPNALVGLAQNYGTSNQRIVPIVNRGVSSLLPSTSLGEQFVNDFLQQKASAAPAPTSFNMSEQNPSLISADPLTKGDHLMQAGDLGNAMLAYEGAVQKNPRDAEVCGCIDFID
ncbi:unnamed protein product [Cylicocyclus nassatus]|uniref:Uncharacterized protein n=1 Tax=Cylicocyclus nassatus TaxID=53992 RepID=A0AA36HDA0_CYLNA|nr:unnamed protein product [Cylicocyclus nassatus]